MKKVKTSELLSNRYVTGVMNLTLRHIIIPECQIAQWPLSRYDEKKYNESKDLIWTSLHLLMCVLDATNEKNFVPKFNENKIHPSIEELPLKKSTKINEDGNLEILIGNKNIIKKFTDLRIKGENLNGNAEIIKKLGTWFGFPECCIDQFIIDWKEAKKKNINFKRYAYNRYINQCQVEGILLRNCTTHRQLEPFMPRLIVEKNELIVLTGIIEYIPCSPLCTKTWFNYALYQHFTQWIMRVFSEIGKIELIKYPKK